MTTELTIKQAMEGTEVRIRFAPPRTEAPVNTSRTAPWRLADDLSDLIGATVEGVGVDGDHRLDCVTGNLGGVGLVDAGGDEVRDVGVAELVRRRVEAGGKLGRDPDIAVEVALAPELAAGRRERRPVSMRGGRRLISSARVGGTGTVRSWFFCSLEPTSSPSWAENSKRNEWPS